MDELQVKLCECGCGKPAPIATGNHSKYGWIKGQAKRFIRGHWLYTQWTQTVEERFWEKVDKCGPDECWKWAGGRDKDGYGRFFWDYRMRVAHRFSYELHYGPIQHRKIICHHCDNPSCVNPKHLFVGSYQENSQDMVDKKRSAKGEYHGMSKLTRENVIKIRKQYISGETQTAIAKELGISQTTVSRAILKQTWKHV